MRDDGVLLGVIRGERRGPAAAAIGAGLAGFSYIYGAGLKLFLLPFSLGIRRQARLTRPVISIGNLSVGGTGKTSMTQHVCERLRERGIHVCVLSRGYRGANEFGEAVVSTEDRIDLDAAGAGDEAYLLARTLPGIPIVVGKDRRRTGALATERFAPDVFVLDDGMQYYWLHRDLEIVLLDAARPFDNGYAFPRGLLREPPSHLRRAHAIVITNVDKADSEAVPALRARIGKLAPGRPIYTARYAARSLQALDRSAVREPGWLAGRRVATFCALGNPASFETQVRREGAEIVYSARQPDHAAPTMGDMNTLIAAACEKGAEAVIVSEKDAVKLPPVGRPLPFYALVVQQAIDDEATFFAQVLGVFEKAG